MEEKWKDIEGYEGIYQISSFGNIRSFYKHNFRKGDRLLSFGNKGYRRVVLFKDGKANKILVHRLVAKAFMPNPYGKLYVNHKDGNRSNNHIENLEWVTSRENTIDGVKRGTIRVEKAIEKRKRPVRQLTIDGRYIRSFKSQTEAKKATGATNINSVCNGNRKSSGGYKWEYE